MSRPLNLGNNPVPNVQTAGWAQGRWGRERKISPRPGSDPRTVQSVESLYQLSYPGPLLSTSTCQWSLTILRLCLSVWLISDQTKSGHHWNVGWVTDGSCPLQFQSTEPECNMTVTKYGKEKQPQNLLHNRKKFTFEIRERNINAAQHDPDKRRHSIKESPVFLWTLSWARYIHSIYSKPISWRPFDC